MSKHFLCFQASCITSYCTVGLKLRVLDDLPKPLTYPRHQGTMLVTPNIMAQCCAWPQIHPKAGATLLVTKHLEKVALLAALIAATVALAVPVSVATRESWGLHGLAGPSQLLLCLSQRTCSTNPYHDMQ